MQVFAVLRNSDYGHERRSEVSEVFLALKSAEDYITEQPPNRYVWFEIEEKELKD